MMAVQGFDPSRPNIARVYDYWLGGKDNFAADRELAEKIVEINPGVAAMVRDNRAFAVQAVTRAAEGGIDQFLDLGAGLPTRPSLDEAARAVNPAARVAYVDYDPVVVSHARVLLADPERSIAVRGDLRDPVALLKDPEIRDHLDLDRPVAVILLAILHFISDDDDPAEIVATIRDALVPGSYLVVSHIAPGRVRDKAVAERVHKIYDRATERIYPRTAEEVTRLLDGFEIVAPEVMAEFAPVADMGGAVSASPISWRALARKP